MCTHLLFLVFVSVVNITSYVSMLLSVTVVHSLFLSSMLLIRCTTNYLHKHANGKGRCKPSIPTTQVTQACPPESLLPPLISKGEKTVVRLKAEDSHFYAVGYVTSFFFTFFLHISMTFFFTSDDE